MTCIVAVAMTELPNVGDAGDADATKDRALRALPVVKQALKREAHKTELTKRELLTSMLYPCDVEGGQPHVESYLLKEHGAADTTARAFLEVPR